MISEQIYQSIPDWPHELCYLVSSYIAKPYTKCIATYPMKRPGKIRVYNNEIIDTKNFRYIIDSKGQLILQSPQRNILESDTKTVWFIDSSGNRRILGRYTYNSIVNIEHLHYVATKDFIDIYDDRKPDIKLVINLPNILPRIALLEKVSLCILYDKRIICGCNGLLFLVNYTETSQQFQQHQNTTVISLGEFSAEKIVQISMDKILVEACSRFFEYVTFIISIGTMHMHVLYTVQGAANVAYSDGQLFANHRIINSDGSEVWLKDANFFTEYFVFSDGQVFMNNEFEAKPMGYTEHKFEGYICGETKNGFLITQTKDQFLLVWE